LVVLVVHIRLEVVRLGDQITMMLVALCSKPMLAQLVGHRILVALAEAEQGH